LPIRIACGSDDIINGFNPDPDTVEGGGANHADVPVDASVVNAAPADVYRSERYGNDFTYRFSVPKNQNYLVRLHFAEVFDDGAGKRLENIYINGVSTVTNLDIYTTAGGMNKAIVREFPDISPDALGYISIRVTAAKDSPDQNAKISAIEILK
jgi:hypothetical protein